MSLNCEYKTECRHVYTKACDICKREHKSFYEAASDADSKCRKCVYFRSNDSSYFCHRCADDMQDMFHSKDDVEEYTPKPKRLGLVERVKKRWRHMNDVAKEMIIMAAASIGFLALMVAIAVLLVLIFGN